MKIKANKAFIVRHNNPTFNYKFKASEIKEISKKHWEYLKNVSYLEVVKKKKEGEDNGTTVS